VIRGEKRGFEDGRGPDQVRIFSEKRAAREKKRKKRKKRKRGGSKGRGKRTDKGQPGPAAKNRIKERRFGREPRTSKERK